MKKPLAQTIHQVLKAVAPIAAVASGVWSPLACGAQGDLDPSFGDVGRVNSALEFGGPAWSVQPLGNDESIVGGGREVCIDYCYYNEYYDEGFVGQLSDTGSLESNVAAAFLRDTQVFDVARQPDGKLVAVGRTVTGHRRGSDHTISLTVFRLGPNGLLDPTFGDSGIVHFLSAEGAQSVTIDPTGRIVVAGSQDGKLIVLRLLANGSPDPAFGAAGVFIGPPANFATDRRMYILRTASGGYRVSTNVSSRYCEVVALTANGALDNAFGRSGIAALDPPPSGLSILCSAMVAQPDGRLLLAGQEGEHGFTVRLLASGKPDPSFTASAVEGTMEQATALAIDERGSILVGGRPREGVPAAFPPVGVPGALIVRLQADGTLDGLFGKGGSTLIDLQSQDLATPVVHDMSVLADGRVLAAGGDHFWAGEARPFVVRLLGDAGGDSPGVLGIMQPSVTATEQGQRAVVTVRRMGGASGEVSVTYRTATPSQPDLPPATPGQDFTQAVGRLSWQNGDATDKDITVRIAANDDAPEPPERFLVALEDVQGGAGLGTQNASVVIAGDIAPAGRLQIYSLTQNPVPESGGYAEVWVGRDFYSVGAVSVMLTPIAGTATPADYSSAPITVSWADGDSTPKPIRIAISNDSSAEPTETFTVELSNPTGGAFVGPNFTATISITDDDQSAGSGNSAGQFEFAASTALVSESRGYVEVVVNRTQSANGSASITVTPIAMTAGPGDFSLAPTTVSWSDGDLAPKAVRITISNDTNSEPTETFTVELSNPTGGASIGPNSTATISITDDDSPGAGASGGAGGSKGGGGGGALDWLVVFILTWWENRRRALSLSRSQAGGHYRP